MGGARGRLIKPSDRNRAVSLIQEAIKEGARLKNCCKVLDISQRTYQRWKAGNGIDGRKGAEKNVAGKLSEHERQRIISVSCSDEYKDSNPYEIFLTLLEKGIYIASISSFYRVLRSAGLLHHRGNKRPRSKQKKPPELVATGPNQVWTWDITWVQSLVKGIFYYSYKIIDIWDKNIVGWEIHDSESEEHSRNLFQRVLAEQGNPNVHIHSDNGNPMKGISLLALLYDLGCSNSFSRPRVSNDNPFIESFFGTLKTSVKYPGKFESIDQAREWMASFIDWYHTQHRHSGIQFFTPQQMRSGDYRKLIEKRNEVKRQAVKRNPRRWKNGVKLWTTNHQVYLNPTNETRSSLKKAG